MREFDDDNLPKDMEDLCQKLLKRSKMFLRTRKIEDRNEARVIQVISRLIVPSAETLATYGATHLDHLIEGVNEGWTGSIAVEGFPRPQPDYSIGFRRSAFTNEQLNKLDPLIGSVYDGGRLFKLWVVCPLKPGSAAMELYRSSRVDLARRIMLSLGFALVRLHRIAISYNGGATVLALLESSN